MPAAYLALFLNLGDAFSELRRNTAPQSDSGLYQLFPQVLQTQALPLIQGPLGVGLCWGLGWGCVDGGLGWAWAGGCGGGLPGVGGRSD